MARFDLPSVDELRELSEPREHAITIYAETSPGADAYEGSLLNAKSAFDRAIRTLRDSGIRHATETALRAQWEKVLTDEAWTRLSRCLAIFLTAERTDVFVLPNRLENQLQVGTYFDVGQLVRAVLTPQSAYALTLSANGWNLWEATSTALAHEVELHGDYGSDAADATNRATIRDRGHVRRLVGDEGKKLLLERYAHHVADAVRKELDHIDPSGGRPLFLFAADPLLDLYRNADTRHRLVPVHGNPDDLRADEIDAVIRREMPAINAELHNALVARVADGTGKGLLLGDLVDISKAATAGAVATLIYDFTIDVLGHVDADKGDIRYADDGYDVLSEIVVTVLDRGGDVIAVRGSEITEKVWNGQALAALRYPMT
ncbi:hypothetical protein QSJ18_10240 [Gordonia sp. ABSL1-1]|uniref:baeRF11 domain-containing protein n=1 Tax=Gordonia sp. ABSL1-1 TaxID=3053923 RepID=UPI002573FA71|nr:hypothetical protein [Gordonia sp. ABSL1-1]MDL9937121.1 hypothetical protein [Gordonia sp. ABSL1-1]